MGAKPHNEKWFFECKRHTKSGVAVEDLNTKVAWADAENPDHLVFITSGHFTAPCIRWIKEITSKKQYRFHTINGAYLKRLITTIPRIYYKYFSSPKERLFLESKSNWLIHNLMPSKETVSLLFDDINFDLLTDSDKCHLMYYLYNESPWYFDEDKQRSIGSKIEDVVKKLKLTLRNSTSNVPTFLNRKNILLTSTKVGTGRFHENDDENCITAELTLQKGTGKVSAQYFLFTDASSVAIEFLLIKSSDFCAEISYIDDYTQQYSDDIMDLLMTSFESYNG